MKKLFRIFLFQIAVFSLFSNCQSNESKQNKNDELTLADASIVWWMAPPVVAQDDKIFEKNKLTVKTFNVLTGLASKNAVLSGSADIGLVATSPLALGAFTKENLIILCSYIQSDDLLSVITLKSNKDTAKFSKPVPPIVIVKGTISEIYFYDYMKKYYPSVDINKLNQLNVKPPDVANVIKNRSANSAVIWEPFAINIASNDSSIKLNRSSDIYSHRIYIVTTPEVLKTKREAINKFVKSIGEACDFLKNNPKAEEILQKRFPEQEKSMKELISKVDFSLKFDYDNMKQLILKDADVVYTLGQTPKDKSGIPQKLKAEDVNYYFNHDFKLK